LGAEAEASADAAAITASTTASMGKSKRLVFTAETPPEESDTNRLYRASAGRRGTHALSGLVEVTLFGRIGR
jgi:hypothetical protein